MDYLPSEPPGKPRETLGKTVNTLGNQIIQILILNLPLIYAAGQSQTRHLAVAFSPNLKRMDVD